MKQFDVIVWSHEENPQFPSEPPFTDPALGWFFGNDINASIQESEAEWIVFAHASAKVDRTFLNDLAQAIESFPMVDAFAPRIATGKDGKFLAGYLRSGRKGFSMIPDDSKLRYVAAPTPYVAAFSRHIVRLTGGFDRSSVSPTCASGVKARTNSYCLPQIPTPKNLELLCSKHSGSSAVSRSC